VIHPTAIIDPSARLADDVSVGAYCVIGADVEIGPGCWIGPHVVINGPTNVGRDNKIFQFASIGEAPQDLKYAGEPTSLEIGHGNTIREYVTINRGTVGGGGVTRVGSDNLIMAYVHIAHDCQIGNQTVFANGSSLAGHVTVGDQVILGGFTKVHQFCAIGQHAFSGIATVINRDVPPYVMVSGNYARAIGINKNGLKRRNFTPETIRALHNAFRILIKARGSREEAMKNVEELAVAHPEVRELVEFIHHSQRDIVR
jgi:UDP-N-acetylglucosamine acyltransferase